MRLNISAWFAPVQSMCPICGRGSARAGGGGSSAVPIKHPEPRQIIASLCGSCQQAIPWIAHAICRICGRAERCEDCVRRQVRHYSISRCAVRYDSLMKDWLALYKYRGHEGVEAVLAAMLAFAYERLLEAALPNSRTTPSFHAITAVPLAPERLQERGFNQAERLALRLSRWYGLNYSPMLQRLRHTEKQSLKTRRSRVVDMRGNFSAAIPAIGPSADPTTVLPADSAAGPTAALFSRTALSRIIIVDDIYTTGSTLDECARVLQQAVPTALPPEVYGLLWARS